MKFGNNKVVVDGLKFDSKKEANRYCELTLLQRAGKITNLERQKKFELIPTIKFGGHTERGVSYIADFVYIENGQQVVEDVKGFKTKDYIIKRKIMLWRYGIKILET